MRLLKQSLIFAKEERMLQIKDMTIAYNENIVVDNFNMNVEEGNIVCIVGESGCGKTSILKSIIGLISPTSNNGKILNGDIIYKDESILNLSVAKQNKLRGEDISVVFQDSGLSLNPIRKIGKQFIQYIRTHTDLSKNEAYDLAVDMLYKMNLKNSKNIMNSYMFQLSGGMKQRVGLAIALSLNPDFLLLDEPTSALDVTTQAQVVEEILKLQNKYKTTILMITHNIPLAIYMADYIIVMKKGKIIEENKSIEIFGNPKHDYTKKLLENIPYLDEI